MKISKTLYGLNLLLFGAGGDATGSNGARYLKGREDKFLANRGLDNGNHLCPSESEVEVWGYSISLFYDFYPSQSVCCFYQSSFIPVHVCLSYPMLFRIIQVLVHTPAPSVLRGRVTAWSVLLQKNSTTSNTMKWVVRAAAIDTLRITTFMRSIVRSIVSNADSKWRRGGVQTNFYLQHLLRTM